MHVFSQNSTSALVGYDKDKTKIQLLQLPADQQVDHGAAFGRIAFGCPEVREAYSRVKKSGDTVIHDPVVLDTPDKASVLVTILKDRDGNEICLVDDDDFRKLCVTKPGDEIINWVKRRERVNTQMKFQRAWNRAPEEKKE
jgi:hypothetical protein